MFGNVERHALVLGKASRGKWSRRTPETVFDSEVVRLEPAGRNLPEKRSTTEQLGDLRQGRIIQILGAPASSGVSVNEGSALTVAAVLACVRLLSDMVAKLPIELYQTSKKGPKPITKHPAIKLMAGTPSDLHTSFELRKLMMTGKLLGGNGYARVYRDGTFSPRAIQWIAPSKVTPELREKPNGEAFATYEIHGQKESLNSYDLIHIRGECRDGITGVSPITLLRESIGTAMTQTSAAGRLMKDGTMFPGYLVSQTNLSQDKIKDAREEWQRNVAGSQNAFRVPILNGGFDFKQTNGMSMSDAQFIESRRFELQEIARHYGIPPFLIGDSTASTTWGTGIQEQTLGFLNFCLDPHLVAFEQALNQTLLTAAELDAGYYFRFDRDELASVSRQDTASYFQTMRNIGVYSANDIRRKLDEPVISAADGGDDYGRPFNASGGTPKPTENDAETPEPATE